MGQGYTRNDSSNNIANGKVIDAADLDGEFDAIVDAFDASTGHNHDGTAAGGGAITKLGPNQEYVGTGSDLHPKTDDTYGLGTSLERWSELHVSGDANVGDLTSTGDLTVDGKVGIGTSSPSAKFDVLNTTPISTPAARFYGNISGGAISNLPGFQIYNNASGGFVDTTLVYGNTTNSYLAFGHHNGTAYAERMRIDSSGKVGIGTSSPTQELHVYNSSATADVRVQGSGGTDFMDLFHRSAEQGLFGSGSVPMVFSTNSTERMRIDSSGNVGIGTNSPTRKLSVNGAAGFGNGTIETVVSFSDRGILGTQTNHDLELRANGSEAMRITPSGNVGIGTSSPQNALSVSGAGADISITNETAGTSASPSFSGIKFHGYQETDNGRIAGIEAGNSQQSNLTGILRFLTRDAGFGGEPEERMRITHNGNVGIGTSSPSAKLHLNGTGATDAKIEMQSGSGVASLDGRYGNLILSSDGDDAVSGSLMAFRVDNTERMRIDGSGRVGIGTTSPAVNFAVGSSQRYDYVQGPAAGIQGWFSSGGNEGESSIVIGDGGYAANGDTRASIKLAPNHGNSGYNAGFEISAEKTTSGTSHAALNIRTLKRSGASGNDLDDTSIVTFDHTGNVGIGTTSPSAKLDVNGDAEINGLTVGLGSGDVSTNTAVGADALSVNTTGGVNTALGTGALQDNTEGSYNTAVGRSALGDNTTGAGNTASGYRALVKNTTGSNNVAAGRDALFSNTTGSGNVATGTEALRSNTTGFNNTATGREALRNNITGSNNTAIGRSALYNNTTGSGNFGAAFRNSSGTYAPVFDPSNTSNRVVMGHTGVTNAYVQVAWTVVSDARDKTEIESLEKGLDFVEQLNPVSYKFRKDRDTEETTGKKRYGFLAQEVLEVEGDDNVIVDTEDLDKLKMTNEELIPVLVKAIQELKAEVDLLKAQ